MKSKAFNFFLLLLLSGANITNAQNKVYGIVQVNDKGFSTNDVFIYDDNNKFLTTPDEKGYYEFFTEKKKMNIVFLLVGSQFIQKEAEITYETEVNIIFEKQTKILSEVLIKGYKIREFQLKRLKDVEGTSIFAGK